MNSSRRAGVRPSAAHRPNVQPLTRADAPAEQSAEPSPWQIFGRRVRQFRERAGMDTDQLTMREVCSAVMLEAIEAGETDPMRAPVSYLDRRLDAGGHLLDAWARALISSHLADDGPVEDLQRHAEQIREFQPGMVPEFFHTDAYARALAEAARPLRASVPGAELDRARRVRRSPYTGGPPYFGLVLDEHALRAVAGDVATTREQLRQLQQFVQRDFVSLQIIPARVRGHPCRSGAFRVLTFSPHHQLAYVPAPCGPGQLVTEPTHVQEYGDLFAALAGAALPPDDSTRLLGAVLDDLAEEPRAITAGRTAPATRTPTDTSSQPHTKEPVLMPG